MQRRRFKNTLTFPDRLSKEAERLREEAERLSYGRERELLLGKARQADTAAQIDKWVASPAGAPAAKIIQRFGAAKLAPRN